MIDPHAPRVFTIPASAPFLPTLIGALTGGRLGFPARRRSARARRRHALSADAARLPAGARCLPRRAASTMPPSCRASSRSAISTKTRSRSPKRRPATIAADALALPPALGGLERRLLLDAARQQMGELARIARRERRPAGRADAGGGLRARRRSGAADRRHDDARRAVGTARRSRSRSVRSILAAHAAVLADRARDAGRRCCAERGCIEPAERRDALIKAEAARLARKTDGAGDRRRLDRLDSGDRGTDRHHRAAAARRRRAARPRHRSRRSRRGG